VKVSRGACPEFQTDEKELTGISSWKGGDGFLDTQGGGRGKRWGFDPLYLFRGQERTKNQGVLSTLTKMKKKKQNQVERQGGGTALKDGSGAQWVN